MTMETTPPGKPASSKSQSIKPQPGAVSHAHWDESWGEYIHTHALFVSDKETGATTQIEMHEHTHGQNGNQKYLGPK